ncbi:hypothetical protein [Catenuloplanes japonicus]|uniref:hypothetical protein n=1 Tax=Catenuloplanes japonicus TaxID=33876 RepID=UPI000524AFC2|nr:hypothetical protein [Catenuloplanes japonicus]
MTAAVDTSAVKAAHATAEAQTAKADGKAGIASAAAVAEIAVFAGAAGIAHGDVRAGFVAACVGGFFALGAVLASLWPRLGGDHGFVRWAGMDPDALAVELAEAPPVSTRAVVDLSQTGLAKNRFIQMSIVLLFAAPLAGVLTAVVA